MRQLNTPKFQKNSGDFYRDLRGQVDSVLEQQKQGNVIGLLKFYVLILCFLIGYFLVLFASQSWLLFVGYGLIGACINFIFLNVLHDAAHHAFFKSYKCNYWVMYLLDVFGANSYIWKLRHIHLHHNFSNVPDWDVDIKQSKWVALFPYKNMSYWLKYQYVYMPFLYFFYTLNWLVYRDFNDLFSKEWEVKYGIEIPKVEKVKCLFFKLLYVLVFIVAPLYSGNHGFVEIIIGFACLHLVQSAIAITALLSAHVDENAVFPNPDEKGLLEHDWAVHQLITTSDFAVSNRLVNFLYGGFNHHVAHHLFPQVPHRYYPYITPIIRDLANQYGYTYKSFSIAEAIGSHFKLLYEVSRKVG